MGPEPLCGGVRGRSRDTPFTGRPPGWEDLPGEGASGVEAQSLVPGAPEGLGEPRQGAGGRARVPGALVSQGRICVFGDEEFC